MPALPVGVRAPMKYCDLTLATPEENLACDEALLELCEAGSLEPVLRFWEPSSYFVVLGYANPVATEVNLEFCRTQAIPVLRRCTGGGTVLQGPGCLNYSLILPLEMESALHSIPNTNRFVLNKHQVALSTLLRTHIELQGHTDLTLGGLKFSGNSQRRRKNALLFHGSFLLNFEIGLIEKALPMPSKQPDYRLRRSHSDFLLNLKTSSQLVKTALLNAWNATASWVEIPSGQIALLVNEKYAVGEWNFKF